MASAAKNIEAIGFCVIGESVLEQDRIKHKLERSDIGGNTLYAFVSEGIVKYIGKTISPLKNVCMVMSVQAQRNIQTKGATSTSSKFLRAVAV